MGHFTIALSNNEQANVQWGVIRKKTSFFNLFRSNKLKNEERKGYIITMGAAKGQSEYRLLKTREGEWTSESDGGFQVSTDNEITVAIKRAIDNFESQR